MSGRSWPGWRWRVQIIACLSVSRVIQDPRNAPCLHCCALPCACQWYCWRLTTIYLPDTLLVWHSDLVEFVSVLIWKRQAGRQERRDKEERNEGNNAVTKGRIQELRREISRKIYLTFQAYVVLYRIQDFQSGLLLSDSLFRPPPPFLHSASDGSVRLYNVTRMFVFSQFTSRCSQFGGAPSDW